MNRRILAILIIISWIFCVMILVSGCLNPRSLDQYSYVMSIGVDRGVTHKYFVTLMMQAENSEKTGEGTSTASLLGAEGDNIFEAIDAMQSMSPKQIAFTRANSLHISSAIAKDGDLEDFLSFEFDAIRLRESANIIIVDGNVLNYLKAISAESKVDIGKFQVSLAMIHSEKGTTTETNTLMFMEMASNPYLDAALILVYCNSDENKEGSISDSQNSGGQSDSSSSGGSQSDTGAGSKSGTQNSAQQNSSANENPIKDPMTGAYVVGGSGVSVKGCAIFSGWNMVGILDVHDTVLMQIGNGGFDKGELAIPYNNESEELDLQLKRKGSPKVEMELGDSPRAKVSITLECRELTPISEGFTWLQIKDQLEENMSKELHRVFKAVQGLKSDVFGFGRYASLHFSTTEEWQEYDWQEKYQKLEVEFEITLKLEE